MFANREKMGNMATGFLVGGYFSTDLNHMLAKMVPTSLLDTPGRLQQNSSNICPISIAGQPSPANLR